VEFGTQSEKENKGLSGPFKKHLVTYTAKCGWDPLSFYVIIIIIIIIVVVVVVVVAIIIIIIIIIITNCN
jgi:hypothetical protein